MTGLRPTLLKFTVFAVVAVVLFVGLFTMMTNRVPGDTRTWQARFTSVSGLRSGDDVRVAGVEVGRVDDIRVIDNDAALVTFTVTDEIAVTRATRITLRYQNLLGQRYLSITREETRPGRRSTAATASQELSPDRVIPVRQTSPGFDLTALLNGFEPLFSVIDPRDVNELADTIVSVLQGESGTVESLLQRTAEATRFLADRDEVFGQVLANLSPVLENLDEQSAQVDATVVQLRRLMTGLARERRTFADTIDDLGALVATTSELLAGLRAPLRRDIRSLRRTTGLLVREKETLGTTLDRLPKLLGAFARSQSYGAYLNVYLCNLGVEVLGQRLWVPSSGGPYSEACR